MRSFIDINVLYTKFLDIYSKGQQLYGGDPRHNSMVSEVRRRCDDLVFVVKAIPPSRREMAETEIAVYEALNFHPRIVRMLEVFHQPLEVGLESCKFCCKSISPAVINL